MIQIDFPLNGWHSSGGGIFWLEDDVRKILGEVDAGKAFVYLFRRFGYPVRGWDSYKDVVVYYLTTDNEGVGLRIIIDTECSFGYMLSENAHKTCYDELPQREGDVPPEHTKSHEYHLALSNSMRELLRPVFVRDVPINILGKVDEDDEKCDAAVDPSHMAGMGIGEVAKAYTASDEWFDLLRAVKALGNGDFVEGVKEAKRILNTEKTAWHSPSARRLSRST